MVSTATRSEIPWWRVDQLRRNFDWRMEARGWSDVDVSGGDV